MLTQFFAYLRNWFCKKKYIGEFEIKNGRIEPKDGSQNFSLIDGQCIRICGSFLNDGVYIYPVAALRDEVFQGEVWSMAVPPEVLALANEIDDWQQKYGSVASGAMSPFSSETLDGVYSYSKQGTSASADGSSNGNDWQTYFGARLSLWRKL